MAEITTPGRVEIPALRREDDLDARDLREVADFAPVMIWRADCSGQCAWANRLWLEFVGRSLAQEIGVGWADGVHPDDRDQCLAAYREAFGARREFSLEYRIRGSDGAYRWLLDRGAPFSRDDVFAGYFGSRIDITDQRELQAYQRTLLAELNHRVKNNLQLMIAFLSIEKASAIGDEAKGVLADAVMRIHGIGAIQEQLHQSSATSLDLADYLPALARSMIRIKAGDAIEIQIDAEPVHCSQHRACNLGLIVNELISDAINRLTRPEGGAIKLCIRKTGDRAEVLICDTGPGFGHELLTASASPAPRRLSLVEALARKSSATLLRENDEGAVVRLQFPLEAGLGLVA